MLCVVALAACLTGCRQFGPFALKAGSAHYSEAIRIATSEELLRNLVRMRYRDVPIFLSVSSISTQFEFSSSGSVSGTLIENVGSGGAMNPNSFGASGSVAYSEKPTITFSVLGGEEFQKRMLAPLDVAAISLLAESGWRPDRVMRLAVEKLNGLHNAPRASGPTPSRAPQYSEFQQAVELLLKLRQDGVIEFELETRHEVVSAPIPIDQVDGDHLVDAAKAGLEFEATPDGQRQLVLENRRLVMRFDPRSFDSADAVRFRSLLRLKRDQMRFELVPLEESKLDPFNPEQRIGELAIDTRSLMGVLYFAANGVRPPAVHVQAGIVTNTVDAEGNTFDWSDILHGLLRVESSKDRPRNAAVAVRHRGYWFYIADDDQTSKTTFNLLNQLFTLQAGDVDEQKPVLTIPVGG